MDNAQLSALAAQYGTPCFLFDETALTARMHAVQEIVGGSVHLCYSIKANPFLLPAMRSLCGTLEVCSPGELEICVQLGIDPGTILFSGVTKTPADIERAMDVGVTRFTAESVLHVQLLNAAAQRRGRVYPVLLRLTAGSQFGMDEADLLQVAGADWFGLRIEGLHYFAGTQRKKLDGQRRELLRLTALLTRLREQYGLPAEKLEYGPGLYYPYFAHEDADDTLSPLRELATDLQAAAQQCELTVEMGRFFASACGYYLTRVVDTKVNCGATYAIVDGGIHHVNYLGGNMGMRVPRILHLPAVPRDTSEMTDTVLCGSLCTTADVLVRRISLPALAVGDVLVFTHIGAYSVTEGAALFLSRTLPRVLLYGEGGVRIARDFMPSAPINCPLP